MIKLIKFTKEESIENSDLNRSGRTIVIKKVSHFMCSSTMKMDEY